MGCGNHPTRGDIGQILGSILQGKATHYSVRESFLRSDPRREGPHTFTTEKAITTPRGRVVYDARGRRAQPDYVNYSTHEIRDVKALHSGQTPEDVYFQYQEQFDRYSETYESARGISPTIEILCYDAD